MQTPIQGDLARVWRHWRQIWMDSYIQTHSCHQLGIWFIHCIFHQAQFSPIILITLLHLSPSSVHFPTGISFINSLVYSVCLFSLTPSFCTLFRVSFQNFQTFFHFILDFLTHTFRLKQNKKNKKKTTILARGRWWSPLLLTFSGAILRSPLIISIFLLLIFYFQASSLLYCSPNFL